MSEKSELEYLLEALGDCIKYIELDSEVPDFVMRYKSALAAGKGR